MGVAKTDKIKMEEWSSRLSNQDLRCKNKCGFYGNPIYQGYCSKCHKEVTQRGGLEYEGGSNTGLGFSKMAMKKSIFGTAKGHNKLFKAPIKRGNPGAATTRSSDTAAGFTMSLPSQPTLVQEQRRTKSSKPASRSTDPFNEFMKTLKKPAAQDIVQHLKAFRKQVLDKNMITLAEQSEMVQAFYEATSDRIKSHPLFDLMSDEEQSEMMDGIEKHLMTSIYEKVFSPASCDDEIKDILLVRRINMLHWLETDHLDVALDMNSYEVQSIFGQAREELWNMENKKAPQDKLNCVSKSCYKLLEALKVSQDRPVSADDFLPALIFLVIHTSCQHLYSNINYIERFSQPIRLLSGESGYYFTNLCSAMMFIENLNAESLKLSQEEFDTKMGYVNGKTDADLLVEEINMDEDYEHIVALQSCSNAMDEFTDHLRDMCRELDQLQGQMVEFQGGVKEQIESILRHPPPRTLYKKKTSPSGSHTHHRSSRDALPPLPPPRNAYVHDMPPIVPPHRTPPPTHTSATPPLLPPRNTRSSSPPPLIEF